MGVATIADLRASLRHKPGVDPAWAKKMLHPVPDLPYVKDRTAYLVEKAKGAVVVDFGCTGATSARIREAAAVYHGIDLAPAGSGVLRGSWKVLDLDGDPFAMDTELDVTLCIAGEILEHLTNPGRFLQAVRYRYPGVPLLLTVPQAGAYELQNGADEMVHPEHVAWYSYTTLATLLRRTGWTLEQARWYGGVPARPEGLIVRATSPASAVDYH